MTIIEAHQAYCETQLAIRNLSPRTIAASRAIFRLLMRHKPDLTDVSDVTPAVAFAFMYEGRQTYKWNSQTALTYHVKMHVFFEWARANGLVTENPFAKLEKPRLSRRLPRRLTTGQALTILDASAMISDTTPYLRARNQAIIALFIFSGLRRSELRHLAYEDVDIDHHTIFVRRGKGDKDRIVPISERLATYLVRYRDERRRRGKTCSEFFASEKQNKRLADETLRRLVIRLVRYTGISFSMHTLRHTFATLMIEGGCNIYSLATMMGHSNINTTTLYLSASAKYLQREIAHHPLNAPNGDYGAVQLAYLDESHS